MFEFFDIADTQQLVRGLPATLHGGDTLLYSKRHVRFLEIEMRVQGRVYVYISSFSSTCNCHIARAVSCFGEPGKNPYKIWVSGSGGEQL